MELENWSQSLFDGTSPGAEILAAGYGVPGCDSFAGDIDIIEVLEGIDSPLLHNDEKQMRAKKRGTRRRSKAMIRPRVPKERVVLVTSMRDAQQIEWVLPRSRKIPPAENAANVAKIANLESALRRAGGRLLETALADRPPEPFKYDFILPDAEWESKFKRRAVDFYNKQQFRWNLQEMRRLEEFAAAHGVEF